MSGRHRNDLPDEPGDGGYDASTPPVFGPANDGSSDWFSPRESQNPPVTPRGGGYDVPDDPLGGPANRSSGYGGTPGYGGSSEYGRSPGHSGSSEYGRSPGYGESSEYGGSSGYGGGSGGYRVPGERGAAGGMPGGATGSGESDIPDWFGNTAERRPGYGAGGFGGASDPGGRGSGRAAYESGSHGGAGVPGGSRAEGSFGGPTGSAGPAGHERRDARAPSGREESSFSGAGYGAYDSISRSDGGRTGAGGSGRSGGSGGSGGSGRSGGSGDYEYGRRRKRSAAGLIGPMAGAVGLALLLGVGVYAFAGAGGGCDGDDALALDIAAAPEIAPAISKTVSRFNDAKHKVDGKCVKAAVRSADPSVITTLLSGQGVESGGNRRPDVWIPDSSLWVSLVSTSAKGKDSVRLTRTSVAQTPIVVGMPQTLAASLRNQGVIANPSWDNLLNAAGGTTGGAVTKNQVIPAGSVRLFVPDPTRNAVGMGSLLLTNTLLANDPNREAIFTGIVRTMRENTTPSVKAQFASFRKDRKGRYPIALAPEQAVWSHNRAGPAEPAVAVYPTEGTLTMDYPLAVTSGESAKQQAARLLEQAVNTEPARDDVRGLGFRSADGKAPTTFGTKTGVSPRRPRQLPAPQPAVVQQIMQAWSKLSLSIRMLSVIDISGSMLEKVDGVTRMQATARVAQGGLSMMPNDSELGQWVFSTEVDGSKDYKEIVPMGALGDRIGSATRRQLLLSSLGQLKPKPTGNTGLYDTILAAYKYMADSYKPEFGNSIVLFTDGENDDENGPSLRETLSRLESMVDPTRPVQVIMIGFGSGVDVNELKQIAKATRGSVYVAQTPGEIQRIFLQALSRRISD
ncbi:von Willebrand factor type A domain-containing protein [Thermomonospora echinospora]|uniref:von Willebrand factor type A domain-containing protein n=1 Tax=Thermomonospora echinospora TaxID=1992 RepID=A0A1H6B7B4_9ACTN|nr:substrate-binding domain-containing protein [Thermomonospora echinospora]SEG56753.1 von Willebrand factor type A domain-containing protein [Thermomonospora echinospora]